MTPVNFSSELKDHISQREQYKKSDLGHWYWDYRDKKVISCIKDEHIILDIGCGEGITLEKLIKIFPNKNIKGIDYIKKNVEICKNRGLPVDYGSVYDLKIENNSIDCVIFLEVIEHLADYKKALQEIHRVLKPNGFLILIFPNDRIFKIARILTLKFKEAFYDPGHVKQWTPNTIKKLLKHRGFMVSRVNNLPFYFWPFSLHCLVVAKKEVIFDENKNIIY